MLRRRALFGRRAERRSGEQDDGGGREVGGSMLNIVAHLRAVDCGMDFQLSLAIRRGLLAERGSSF
jgi:hypothetical protein